MKSSIGKTTTTRAPLSTIKPSTNTLTKSSAPPQKDSKVVAAPRTTVPSKISSTNSQVNTKRESIAKETMMVQDSTLLSQNELREQLNSDSVEKEMALGQKPVEEIGRPSQVLMRGSQATPSNVDVIIKDHELCFEKQKEVIAHLKTENDVQSEDIIKLRVEVSRWKEALAKSDAEIAAQRERAQFATSHQSVQEETILNLRREILLLQKKNEGSHDYYAQQQIDSIKLRREICELKGEREELKALLTRERNEKEAFWQQLQDERRKQHSLLESSSKFKEENRALELLIEKMRDELQALRVSNEEVLKHLNS
jgi:hypothetical protein